MVKKNSREAWEQLPCFPPGSVVTFSKGFYHRIASAAASSSQLGAYLAQAALLAGLNMVSGDVGTEVRVGTEVVVDCRTVTLDSTGVEFAVPSSATCLALFEMHANTRSLRFVGVVLLGEVLVPRHISPNGYFIPRTAFRDLDVVGEQLFADSWMRDVSPPSQMENSHKRKRI